MTLLLRRTLVLAGAAMLLAVVVLGAARASAPPTPMSAGPAAATDVGTQAAGLDPALGADLDAILAADQTSARPVAAAGRLRHLAAWQRLVHATVVVDLKNGGLTTLQLDHGTISAVTATTLTIKESGGTSVTVALSSDSRVRRGGTKATVADLKAADDVFVLSKVEAGGTTAYLVVVPRT